MPLVFLFVIRLLYFKWGFCFRKGLKYSKKYFFEVVIQKGFFYTY
ncbi:MAG: hypothetical protein ACI9KN_001869 [Gammaproteobacteria bacterium]|jgi:hypothetical protein